LTPKKKQPKRLISVPPIESAPLERNHTLKASHLGKAPTVLGALALFAPFSLGLFEP